MSLGAGAYKVGENGQCSNTRRYPWQPCERPPQGTVTLPTNTYLALRHRGREGWEKHSTKMASKQQGYSEDTCVHKPKGASAKGIAPPPPPPQA